MISDDVRGIARHLEALVDARGRLRLGAETTHAIMELMHTVAGQVRTLERNTAAPVPAQARDPGELENELVKIGARVAGLADDVARWAAGSPSGEELARTAALVGEIAERLDRLYTAVEDRARPRPADRNAPLGEGVVDLAARRAARRPAAARRPGGGGDAA